MSSVTVGKRSYRLAPLAIEDREKIRAGASESEAEASLSAFSEEHRRKLVAVAWQELTTGARLLYDPAMPLALATVRGWREMVRMSLSRGNPSLSESQSRQILDRMTEEQFVDALSRVKAITAERIEREVAANLGYSRFWDLADVVYGRAQRSA